MSLLAAVYHFLNLFGDLRRNGHPSQRIDERTVKKDPCLSRQAAAVDGLTFTIQINFITSELRTLLLSQPFPWVVGVKSTSLNVIVANRSTVHRRNNKV